MVLAQALGIVIAIALTRAYESWKDRRATRRIAAQDRHTTASVVVLRLPAPSVGAGSDRSGEES